MKIKDKIYGTITINSPVIIELLRSSSLQRLKKIAQFGIPDELYHKKGFSRYEHCVGVMNLLKRLGASEEEQIAGLLHDVSHTAFSHLIDWIVGNEKKENYQDLNHKKFIEHSEIPSILRRYGYSFNKVATYKKFKLLERKATYICADRLDYAFRELSNPLATRYLNNLTVKDEVIVFKNKNIARIFAENYLRLQKEHWGGFEAVSRYMLLGNSLRRALEKKIITFANFWENDSFVLNKLKKSKDPIIQQCFRILRKKSLEELPKSGVVVHKKFRYIDPGFVFKNKIIRLSRVDKIFKNKIKDARADNSAGIIVPLTVL